VVAGHRDLVILFRWWYKEHPLSNLEHLGKWEFKQDGCHADVEDEGVADAYEYDETVAFDPQAQYIGRIGYEKGETEITLDSFRREYLRYENLFLPELAERIASSQNL